jgi:hypothetical protein
MRVFCEWFAWVAFAFAAVNLIVVAKDYGTVQFDLAFELVRLFAIATCLFGWWKLK